MPILIRWFRVIPKHQAPGTTQIVCEDCQRRHKLEILNRVFGSSQTCMSCGRTDAPQKETP